MLLSLKKFVRGPWESVQQYLWEDLNAIETALNKKWASVINQDNTIVPAALGTIPVSNGGTGFSSYTKGDLLVGNAAHTLDKLGVGSDGQVLSADSTATDGVAWATPVSAIPEIISTNTVYSGLLNYITEESIEIAAGVSMEVGAGTRFVINRNTTGDELYFVDLGAVNNAKVAVALNLSNVANVLDWFLVINATQPTPITGTAFHTRKSANWMGPTFRWPSGTTMATFTGLISTSTNVADDSNGAALAANTTYAHSTGTSQDNLGWTFQVPVTQKRRVLYVQTGAFACDVTITFKFSNSTMPTKTYTIVDSNNAGVIDAPTGVILTFWGPPCILTVSANSASHSTTAPTCPFAFAILTEG